MKKLAYGIVWAFAAMSAASAFAAGTLPAGYTEVEYIQGDGSSTRILTDYLCNQENLDTAAIYGYDREELTHTSVAAQIVSGSADAGMGIYSAAKLYDLDFIPICIEEYDLIIPDHAWDTPQVQQMIATLKSEEFKNKILSLGGYTVENPGEIIPLN